MLLASACTLLMISCSNDAELINVAETTGLQTKAFVGEADFQIVDYAGDKCIQFKNDSVFNAMLWEMNDMSEEERNNIFSGAGFVSQWQLMQEADQEQELIVDNYEKDLSQPWPAHQIKEFKQKYDDVFMFEPYDSTDFIAHYKLKGSTYSSFVNRRGVFLIGDSVAHAPVYKALEEYFGSGISLYGNNEATNEKNDINLAESKYQIPGGDYEELLRKAESPDEKEIAREEIASAIQCFERACRIALLEGASRLPAKEKETYKPPVKELEENAELIKIIRGRLRQQASAIEKAMQNAREEAISPDNNPHP